MFLFGSYTSPMPKIDQVTQDILNGNYHFHSDNKIYPQSSGWTGIREVRNADFVKACLKLLVATIRENSRSQSSSINYEDFKYTIEQLVVFEGTNRNPALKPFRDLLSGRILQLLSSRQDFSEINMGFIEGETSFGDILSTMQCWVEWVIYENLIDRDKPKPPQALTLFFKSLDLNKHPATVCTLNHDLKTEQALNNLSVGYKDGFTQITESSAMRFAPKELVDSTKECTLYKLHGSINWFWSGSEYHKLLEPDTDYDSGDNYRGYVGTANLLSGTINKLEAYNYGVYPWIWAAFQNQLLATKRIICSGYGFMDLGVTSRLHGWLTSLSGNQLLIIDPSPKALIERCKRHAISNISGFFREGTYHICSDANEIENAPTPIILLECGFEALNESDHFPPLRKFAYH